ncbi:MAG: 2OG-Fe(II) oxygenase [Cellvibrionaceae bacterium]|nr:2OG-Fe(II) oxygenase [Cellvibrionaceae bacterium]
MSSETQDRTENPHAVLFARDFIVVYRGLDQTLCDAIIAAFDRDRNKWQGKVGRAGETSQQAEIKSSWDLEIPEQGEWRGLYQQMHSRIQACTSHYLSASPVLQSFPLQMTGYKIQMYPRREGYFRWHADSVGKDAQSRVAAMVLYLNDVDRGGETEFFHQHIKIPPRAGNILLFPAGWNYMHCGQVPESSDKYVISSFIKIRD